MEVRYQLRHSPASPYGERLKSSGGPDGAGNEIGSPLAAQAWRTRRGNPRLSGATLDSPGQICADVIAFPLTTGEARTEAEEARREAALDGVVGEVEGFGEGLGVVVEQPPPEWALLQYGPGAVGHAVGDAPQRRRKAEEG